MRALVHPGTGAWAMTAIPQAGTKGFMSFVAERAAILPDGLVRKD